MKVYKVKQNKRTYKVKWVESKGTRQEKSIEISCDSCVVGMFIDGKLAKKQGANFEKNNKGFETRRNVKTEIVGKNMVGVDEVVAFDYKVEPVEVEEANIYTSRSGKKSVDIDGVLYICGDPAKQLEK